MFTITSFLHVFLALSGVYAIVKALGRLNRPSPGAVTSDSALQTKWFKWLAPAGLTYGILAIVLVIVLIRIDSTPKYESAISALSSRVQQLEEENKHLRYLSGDTTGSSSSLFHVAFKNSATKPIFGARVLLSYSPSAFNFKGIEGISDRKDGSFQGDSREVKIPDRFFIRLSYYEVWGVNVFKDEQFNTIVQFYRP